MSGAKALAQGCQSVYKAKIALEEVSSKNNMKVVVTSLLLIFLVFSWDLEQNMFTIRKDLILFLKSSYSATTKEIISTIIRKTDSQKTRNVCLSL